MCHISLSHLDSRGRFHITQHSLLCSTQSPDKNYEINMYTKIDEKICLFVKIELFDELSIFHELFGDEAISLTLLSERDVRGS